MKRADGRHFPIALSSTDAVPPNEDESTPDAKHLLELKGLRQVVQVLARMGRPCAPDGSSRNGRGLDRSVRDSMPLGDATSRVNEPGGRFL